MTKLMILIGAVCIIAVLLIVIWVLVMEVQKMYRHNTMLISQINVHGDPIEMHAKRVYSARGTVYKAKNTVMLHKKGDNVSVFVALRCIEMIAEDLK